MATKKIPAPEKEEVFILDLSKVQPKTLKGKPVIITDLHEKIGENLNMGLMGIKGRRLAEKIFDGGEVELSLQEKYVLISFFNSDACTLLGYVIEALLKELET